MYMISQLPELLKVIDYIQLESIVSESQIYRFIFWNHH